MRKNYFVYDMNMAEVGRTPCIAQCPTLAHARGIIAGQWHACKIIEKSYDNKGKLIKGSEKEI